ncbi:MAG TPA: BatD family protein, partial [Polyangiales bacterium]
LPQPPAMDPNAPPDDRQAAADPRASSPPTGPLSGAQFDNDLFLRTVVDKPEAQLGEQVTVTVYLYVRGGLSQNPTVSREPTAEGFWVQDLLPVQRTLAPVRQEVNGRTFSVFVLRRFAAFALRPGKLEIGAPSIEISGGDSLFDLLTGPRQTVRRNGVAVPVQVNPLPAAASSAPVHVGSLSLEASVDPSVAKVGDAITLRVVAKGQGNLKALKLSNPVLDGVDVLAPEIDDKVSTDLDQVGGERSFRWLLLPRRPGKLEIPAFSVQVFDPQNKGFREVRTQPLTLAVSGVALADPAQPKPSQAATEPAPAVLAPSFGPARTRSELRRGRFRLVEQPWFLWAVLAGPLACTGAVLAGALRRNLRARRKEDPSEQALRAAEAKLREAETSAASGDSARASGAIIAALRAALQARLSEPVGGLTLAALESLCIERGMSPPLAQRIVASLSEAELSRFDPSRQAGGALARQLQESQTLVREISRFRAKEAA